MLGGFLLFRAVAEGFDAVHREQTGVVHARLAGPGSVGKKAFPHHRERRWDAVEFEVVALAWRQGLAITVAAIVGQSDEHGPVAVGQKRAVCRLAVLEDVGCPPVGEIHQGQATPNRLFGVDHPLFASHDLDSPMFGRRGGLG